MRSQPIKKHSVPPRLHRSALSMDWAQKQESTGWVLFIVILWSLFYKKRTWSFGSVV